MPIGRRPPVPSAAIGARLGRRTPAADDGGACPRPERRGRRAGATCGAAIGVGLGLGALVILAPCCCGGRPSSASSLVAVVLAASWELVRALRAGGVRAPLVPAARRRPWRWCRSPGSRRRRGPGRRLPADRARPRGLAAAPRARPATCGTCLAGVFVALYVPFLAGFAVLLLRAGRRRRPGGHLHRDGRAQRRRRLHGRRALRQAPDGARRSARRSPGRASPARRCSAWSAALRHPRCCSTAAWWQGVLFGVAVVPSPRRSATSPSR